MHPPTLWLSARRFYPGRIAGRHCDHRGVLTGISLGVLGKVRATADGAACLSNMRQIGAAVNLYIGDNNGTLPGPLYGGQPAYFSSYSAGSLPLLIAPYVGMKVPTTATLMPIFSCPAFLRAQGKNFATNDPIYLMNQTVSTVQQPGAYPNDPWGYIGISNPCKMVNLQSSQVSLTNTWAVTEMDGQQTGAQAIYGSRGLPATMVHGYYRNAMFFDGHGGRVDVNNKPL